MKKWPVAKWSQLQKEFDVITSYSEKLKYWIDNKLYELDLDSINKAFYFEGATETIENSPTINIWPNNKEENFLFNSYILENFHLLYPIFDTFQTLSEKFELKLSKAKFPQKLFDEEFQAITNRLVTEIQNPTMIEINATAAYEYSNYLGINKGYDLEAKGKTDEFIMENEFDQIEDIYGVFQGVHIARYHRYLIDKAEELGIGLAKPEFEDHSNFKLTWNGDSKSLIILFYNLKNQSGKDNKALISNTNKEIAEFLIKNFHCFKNVKLESVLGQFSNTKAPKRNSLDIDDLLKSG